MTRAFSDPGVRERLEKISTLRDKPKQQEVRNAASKLKRLTFSQVEGVLARATAKQGYRRFTLGEPVMGKNISVEFTVQNTDESRDAYDSRRDLGRLIEKALSDTRWTLMSEGIHERVGILSGRLRAVEDEEELIKLIKSRRPKGKKRA